MFKLEDSLVSSLSLIDSNYPHRKKDFYNSLLHKNIKIYNWLADEYVKIYGNDEVLTANVFASGFLLYDSYYIKKMNLDNIIYYDYDPDILPINWQCLKHIRSQILIDQKCLDVILDSDYLRKDNVDVLINFSCEKMIDQKLVVNMEYQNKNPVFCFLASGTHKRGNINIHSSLADFEKSTGLSNIKYSGETHFIDEKKYLVIGEK